MPPSVLAGYDPKTFDRGPVNLAAAVSRATGAPLVIASVYSGGGMMDRLASGEFAGDLSDDARTALDHARTDLRALGVEADLHTVEATSAPRGLAKAMEQIRPGLVVVGSTGRGAVGRVLAGSTAERVIHGAPCPVAVAPHGYAFPNEGLQTIGVAFAPTDEGREALRAAGLLARSRGARLRAILALDAKLAERQGAGLLARRHHEASADVEAGAREAISAEQTLAAAIDELAPGAEPDVLYRDPAEGLVAASTTLDLLVMGSRAYGPTRAVMLGGVSRKVIASAGCPVLVLPRGTEGQLDALVAAADEVAPRVPG